MTDHPQWIGKAMGRELTPLYSDQWIAEVHRTQPELARAAKRVGANIASVMTANPEDCNVLVDMWQEYVVPPDRLIHGDHTNVIEMIYGIRGLRLALEECTVDVLRALWTIRKEFPVTAIDSSSRLIYAYAVRYLERQDGA